MAYKDFPLNAVIAANALLDREIFTEEQIERMRNNPMLLANFTYALLKDSEDKREYDMIRMYYQEDFSLGDIGGVFEVSGERVRQIISHALFRIRRPNNAAILTEGILEQHIIQLTEKYKQGEEKGYQKGYTQAVVDCLDKEGDRDALLEMLPDIRIEELGISGRLRGCLKRKGIDTLKQLANTDRNTLLHIPYFGEKSYQETISILTRYHYL